MRQIETERDTKRDKERKKIGRPRAKCAGLFLVNFLTEPVGLSLHNFTEPDGKTASPAANKQISNHVSLHHSTGIKQWLSFVSL